MSLSDQVLLGMAILSLLLSLVALVMVIIAIRRGS